MPHRPMSLGFCRRVSRSCCRRIMARFVGEFVDALDEGEWAELGTI